MIESGRNRFFETARGSAVIDTCMELAVELKYVNSGDLNIFGESTLKIFKCLAKIKASIEIRDAEKNKK
jgi:hypothetical protein